MTAERASRLNAGIGIVAAVLVYSLILQWTYANKISPVFAYLGDVYRSPSVWAYPIAILLAAAVALVMPRSIRSPSDFVLWVLYILVAAPSIVVPHFADILSVGESLRVSLVVALIFAAVRGLTRFRPRIPIRLLKVDERLVWLVVAAVSVMIYAYIELTVGLSITLVGLADVYDLRFAYRDEIASGGAVLGYAVRLQANVINPLIVAKGFFSRQPLMVIGGLFGQLLLFPVTGYKVTLLSIPLLLILGFYLRRERRLTGLALLSVATGAAIAALAVDAVRGTLFYAVFYTDRVLITPGVLTAAHVDVFSDQPKALWADSVLSGVTNSPYDRPPAFIVGNDFRNNAEASANVNLFGNGFANYGFLGMLIEASVLVLVLWTLDEAGKHLSVRVSCLLLIIPTFATANSGIFTSLFSNGYGVAILLMLALPASFAASRGEGDTDDGRSPPRPRYSRSRVPQPNRW